MKKLPDLIIERSLSLPEGAVLAAKEFLNLGSRAAVDQALSRLTKAGRLLRVCRGFYVAPVKSRFGERAPDPEKVVSSLAEKSCESVASSGARAANALGLTHQVPVRQKFLTNGRSRTLTIGNAKVELSHAPKWMLGLGTSPAGDAVRALAWLGETQARRVVPQLHRRLPQAEWFRLIATQAALPAWMARILGWEAAHG